MAQFARRGAGKGGISSHLDKQITLSQRFKLLAVSLFYTSVQTDFVRAFDTTSRIQARYGDLFRAS